MRQEPSGALCQPVGRSRFGIAGDPTAAEILNGFPGVLVLRVISQPVGQACGSNPIGIIIPCHRVLSRRSAGGFSAPGGIETKMALLKHENAWPYLL